MAVHPLRRVQRWAATRSVAICLIAGLVAVWGFEHLVIGQVRGGRRIGYLAFGALPNTTVGRGSPHQWWRYVSDALVNDVTTTVNLWVNGVLLLVFGGHVERLYGRRICLATLAVASASGGVAWMVWTALGLVATPHYTLGASAAACGLMGLLLAFAWRARSTAPAEQVQVVKAQAALGVAVIVLLGLVVPGLNNAAHAGGLLGGLLLGAVVPPLPECGGRDLRRSVDVGLWAVVSAAGLAVVIAGAHLTGRLLSH